MHNVRTKEGESQLSEVTDLVQLAVAEMWQKIQNPQRSKPMGSYAQIRSVEARCDLPDDLLECVHACALYYG